jgi:GTP-binding protein Era
MSSQSTTRTGHIALAGAPNVGKSSLLNRIVGAHLALVSPKPQATRLPVVGLHTTADTQFILHDLPGLLEPGYLLQKRMREAALEALAQVDVILHLHPATEPPPPPLWTLAGLEKPLEVPVLTVYTKADLLEGEKGKGKEEMQKPKEDGPERGAFPFPLSPFPLLVSATTGQGIPELLDLIRSHLPVADFEFDPDYVGTQPLHFFVGEYLREAAFDLLEHEVPYAIAVEVEEFRENTQPVYIRVSLYVERESQKGIVVGQGGRTLKAIGTRARASLEALLGQQVFLDSRVKVLPNWRRSEALLSRLGFPERGAFP